jgi:hypothetical protein
LNEVEFRREKLDAEGGQVKTILVLLVSVILTSHAFAQVAQRSGPAREPARVAQAPAEPAGGAAGGPATGASLPPTFTGPASSGMAWIATAVAGVAAAANSYSMSTNH